MALFMPGHSKCPICGEVLNEQDERFGTWGIFTVPPDLFGCCDAVMLWSCYAEWPRRPESAKAYFDFWVGNGPHNLYQAKAYLDDRVFVSVNPFLGESGEADLVMAATGSRARVRMEAASMSRLVTRSAAATGSRARVRMEEWERWLDAPETSAYGRQYPLEIAELRQVAPALKAAIPTVDAVSNALDAESKGWTHRGGQEAEPDSVLSSGDF